MESATASMKRKADTLRESLAGIIGSKEESRNRDYEISLPHDTMSKDLAERLADYARRTREEQQGELQLQIESSEDTTDGSGPWMYRGVRWLARKAFKGFREHVLPGNIIMPNNRAFKAYSLFIVILALFTCWEMPFNFAFLSGGATSLPLAIANAVVDLFFIYNILCNFRLAYKDAVTQKLITNRARIAVKYVLGWFALDALACVPWDLIREVTDDNWYTLVPVWIQLVRLRHIHDFFDRLSMDIRFNYFVVKIFATLLTEYYFVHVAACFFYFLAEVNPNPANTWIGSLVENNGIEGTGWDYSNFKDLSIGQVYVTSLYWAVVTMAGVGYGDIHPVNVQEMLFAIAYILWDLLFMAYIIGEFTALVVRGETATEALRNKLSAITKFCIRRHVPRKLQDTLQSQTVIQQLFHKEDKDVLMDFPDYIRKAAAVALYTAPVSRCYLFENCSKEFMERLCHVLEVELYLANELLASPVDAWDQTYFVLFGEVEVTARWSDGSQYPITFHEGEMFGEVVLVMPSAPKGRFSARVVQMAKLLRLDSEAYRVIASLHPSDSAQVLENFKNKWGMSDKERELGASVHAQHAGSTVHTQLGSMRLMELLNGWGSSLDHLTAQRAMAAIRVAAEGDLERLRHMSSSGIDLTLSDFDGRTALHLAAARGYPSVCLFLIAEGADVNKKDNFGMTPLLEALRAGHAQTIEMLRRHGARVLLSDESKELCQAVKAGTVEYLERLLNCGIDPNVRDYDQRTPLHVAAAESFFVVCRILLRHGADPWLRDRMGNLPLDEALRNGSKPVIQLLKESMRRLGMRRLASETRRAADDDLVKQTKSLEAAKKGHLSHAHGVASGHSTPRKDHGTRRQQAGVEPGQGSKENSGSGKGLLGKLVEGSEGGADEGSDFAASGSVSSVGSGSSSLGRGSTRSLQRRYSLEPQIQTAEGEDEDEVGADFPLAGTVSGPDAGGRREGAEGGGNGAGGSGRGVGRHGQGRRKGQAMLYSGALLPRKHHVKAHRRRHDHTTEDDPGHTTHPESSAAPPSASLPMKTDQHTGALPGGGPSGGIFSNAGTSAISTGFKPGEGVGGETAAVDSHEQQAASLMGSSAQELADDGDRGRPGEASAAGTSLSLLHDRGTSPASTSTPFAPSVAQLPGGRPSAEREPTAAASAEESSALPPLTVHDMEYLQGPLSAPSGSRQLAGAVAGEGLVPYATALPGEARAAGLGAGQGAKRAEKGPLRILEDSEGEEDVGLGRDAGARGGRLGQRSMVPRPGSSSGRFHDDSCVGRGLGSGIAGRVGGGGCTQDEGAVLRRDSFGRAPRGSFGLRRTEIDLREGSIGRRSEDAAEAGARAGSHGSSDGSGQGLGGRVHSARVEREGAAVGGGASRRGGGKLMRDLESDDAMSPRLSPRRVRSARESGSGEGEDEGGLGWGDQLLTDRSDSAGGTLAPPEGDPGHSDERSVAQKRMGASVLKPLPFFQKLVPWASAGGRKGKGVEGEPLHLLMDEEQGGGATRWLSHEPTTSGSSSNQGNVSQLQTSTPGSQSSTTTPLSPPRSALGWSRTRPSSGTHSGAGVRAPSQPPDTALGALDTARGAKPELPPSSSWSSVEPVGRLGSIHEVHPLLEGERATGDTAASPVALHAGRGPQVTGVVATSAATGQEERQEGAGTVAHVPDTGTATDGSGGPSSLMLGALKGEQTGGGAQAGRGRRGAALPASASLTGSVHPFVVAGSASSNTLDSALDTHPDLAHLLSLHHLEGAGPVPHPATGTAGRGGGIPQATALEQGLGERGGRSMGAATGGVAGVPLAQAATTLGEPVGSHGAGVTVFIVGVLDRQAGSAVELLAQEVPLLVEGSMAGLYMQAGERLGRTVTGLVSADGGLLTSAELLEDGERVYCY